MVCLLHRYLYIRYFAYVFDLLIGLHSLSLVQSNIYALLNTNSLSLVCISHCLMWLYESLKLREWVIWIGFFNG